MTLERARAPRHAATHAAWMLRFTALALCATSMFAPIGRAETTPEVARAASRPHGVRLRVDEGRIRIMDGDTAEISWSRAEKETVRVLGIDTPELFVRGARARNPAAPRGFNVAGVEARGFARGAFAMARDVELLRAATLDRYGRTLGYFFLDGRNYSALALRAGVASETVSRYGDNGFPREAEEVRQASRARRGR